MPDRATPLEELVQQLRSRIVPSLATLIDMLQDHEDFAEFVKMVRELLPEREREILGEKTIGAQTAAFASHFEDRYFPLDSFFKDEGAETYQDLLRGIPIITLGFGYQEYDDLVENGDSGLRLMTYIFSQPSGDNGARVALAEACQQYIPDELLQRIPSDGYSREEIHRLLDGTSYSPLAVWGDILFCSTDNVFLDNDEETYASSVPIEWTKEEVEWLVPEWQQAEEKQRSVFEFARKFKENPQKLCKATNRFHG